MFSFLSIIGIIGCTSLYKTINPKQVVTFYEEITEDKQYSELSITRISQTGSLFYRIVPVGKSARRIYDSELTDMDLTEQESNEGLEHPLERNVNERLETPGVWKIEVYNRGGEVERFAISMYPVMKIHKGNEDVQALRNILNQIQGVVDALGNENRYATTTQASNIKSAESLNFYLNLMCFLPFIVFLIAQLENSIARQMVRPKGKKFKWLFGQGK